MIGKKIPAGALAAAVAALTLIAFLPALRSGFSNWDDPENILNNPYYRGLDPAHLRWMFTTFLDAMYLPLTWLTLGADYVLWGMNPAGYHLTSLLFHAATAAVFFFVALRLLALAQPGADEGAARLAAAFAALVFAVHPLRVEPVAWASARGDVVAGFFVMLSLFAYVKGAAESAGRRYGRWIAAAAVFYALALLGKGAALTLPLGLIVLDVYPLRRFGSRRVWLEKLPFFALALLGGLVAVYGKYYGGLIYGLADYTLAQRLALSAYGLIFYLWKTIWPAGLAPLYQLPHAVGFSEPEFLVSALAAAALTIALFAVRRRWPWALAAWAWHGVMLLPTLGLLQNGPQIAADRYDYLAAPAAALLAGGAALYLSRRSDAIFGPAAAAAALLAALTWTQAALWRDPVALWSRAVAYDRDAHLAHHYLGSALLAAGNVEQALDEFEITKRINPNYASAYMSIAFIRGQLGDTEGAIENYRIGVRLFPGSAAGHFNLANQLFKRGDKDAAIEEYRAALALDPRNASAHNNLGFLLAAKGEVDEPLAHFTAALQLNPRHVTAYYNMGMLMLKTGHADRAAEYFAEALRLSPGAPDLERALGFARARQGKDGGR